MSPFSKKRISCPLKMVNIYRWIHCLLMELISAPDLDSRAKFELGTPTSRSWNLWLKRCSTYQASKGLLVRVPLGAKVTSALSQSRISGDSEILHSFMYSLSESLDIGLDQMLKSANIPLKVPLSPLATLGFLPKTKSFKSPRSKLLEASKMGSLKRKVDELHFIIQLTLWYLSPDLFGHDFLAVHDGPDEMVVVGVIGEA